MYKRITRNSTFLVITIGRRQRRPDSMYRKRDFCSFSCCCVSITQTTRYKHARAIQIEVVNEVLASGQRHGRNINFIFDPYVDSRSDNCFARLNDPEDRFDRVEQEIARH